MKTIKIKGNDYVTVNERVIEFRKQHPLWRITTRILEHSEGSVMMIAEIADEQGNIIGDGYAYEKQSWGGVNKFKYIENCQTSAVGRAIGLGLGIGIDTAIASAEEMETVTSIDEKEVLKEEKKKDITTWLTKEQKKEIETLIQSDKIQEAKDYVNKYCKAPFGMKKDWREELVEAIKQAENSWIGR